jgi:hypothetical protein
MKKCTNMSTQSKLGPSSTSWGLPHAMSCPSATKPVHDFVVPDTVRATIAKALPPGTFTNALLTRTLSTVGRTAGTVAPGEELDFVTANGACSDESYP